MENTSKTHLTNILNARGVEIPSDDKKLITEVVGYVCAENEFMERDDFDWHIPSGYAAADAEEGGKKTTPTPEEVAEHIGEEVTEENKQYDLDNDGDIDENDVELANSTIEVDDNDEKVESNAWSYVHDEESFNASLANGALAKYYEKFPDEDLEAVGESRNATFNDRVYVGSFDDNNEVVKFKAGWEETSQKITNVADSSEVYYMKRIDGEGNQYARFQGESWTLYTDVNLTEEAGHVFHIMRLEFDGFEHTYNAAVNAPGSSLPWVVVNFNGEETHEVSFKYDGAAIASPWTNAINWGIASVANDLNIADFDESKLKMYI